MQRDLGPVFGKVVGLIEPSSLWNYGLTVATIIVLWIASKSAAAKALLEIISSTSEARKGKLIENDEEIARLTVELKTTTRELRQAREFTVEDRNQVRLLLSRCERYQREINHHRLQKGLTPILAGQEDDEHNPPY